MITRRMLGLSYLTLCAAPAFAQAAWPNRPIRFVIAFPAGGLSDRMGRMVAEGFATALGQTVIVDNRGGAGGTAGTRQALSAEPDGYT
ncbi:MAG: tripartite tricarboxylate transporter substrate binding protein, partial [Methylobacterium sp.]|nr:tripartite tricarboxylate transporter substrate binding protein [Methylobacterium sp.]